MTKYLTAKKKAELLLILIQRDHGYYCFYCKQSFTNETPIIEHLNGDRTDNGSENLVLAHQSCNIKKSSYLEYEIMAKEKLKQNEDQLCVSERKHVENNSLSHLSTEMEISQSNNAVVERWLSEKVNVDGFVLYKNALDSLTYICRTQTGFGSQQSVRNYIDSLTSDEAPFMISKDENKKKIIIRRIGN